MKYFKVMHFINAIILGWSNFFRVITIFWSNSVKWFTKISKFEEGFNDNELLWSFTRPFHCVMLLLVLVQQARKFCSLISSWKEKLCHSILCSARIYHSFEDTCNLIKVVTFDMNSKFTEVTLNSFIFVIDIFLQKSCKEIWDDWYYTWS